MGFLVVLQSKSFSGVREIIRRDFHANIFREIHILKTTNQNLEDTIGELETGLLKASDQEQALKVIGDEIARNKIIAGHVDISGPGIELIIKQNIALFWLTDIVNELLASGAEAISINNIRLTDSTIGFDILPNGQVSLNGVILTVPYNFHAIGNKKVIYTSLTQSHGIVQRFKESIPNLEIILDQKDVINMQKAL